MTPKELRAAAVHTADDLVCDHRLNGDKIMQMCQYILSTVREDDGEPVTKSWVADRTSFEFVEMDAGIWCILTDSYLPIDMTRGQFRRLCEGLGIVLIEQAH